MIGFDSHRQRWKEWHWAKRQSYGYWKHIWTIFFEPSLQNAFYSWFCMKDASQQRNTQMCQIQFNRICFSGASSRLTPEQNSAHFTSPICAFKSWPLWFSDEEPNGSNPLTVYENERHDSNSSHCTKIKLQAAFNGPSHPSACSVGMRQPCYGSINGRLGVELSCGRCRGISMSLPYNWIFVSRSL